MKTYTFIGLLTISGLFTVVSSRRWPGENIECSKCEEQEAGNQTSACDAGWTEFQRQTGPRCLKVFPSSNISQMVAEALCQREGGTLSGLENRAEGLWMNAQALPFRPPTSSFNVIRDIWIGGYRKPECMGPTYAPSCAPAKTNSFYWTDPSVTGTAGFESPWWTWNPDNAFGKQPCLWLTVQKEELQNSIFMTRQGSLADVGCLGEKDAIFGYACSKAPKTQKVVARLKSKLQSDIRSSPAISGDA